MASYIIVKVRYGCGTYTTSSVGGVKASCTASAQQAVERLVVKLYGDNVPIRVEEAGHHWRIYLPEAN